MKHTLFIILIALFCLPAGLSAQEEATDSGFSVGTDLMSRYVWRGIAFSTTPSVQPYIEYSKGGFAIGTWGAYSFHGMDGAEVDLYLSYTFLDDQISVGLTDYFFPAEDLDDNDYFNYKSDETGHVYEAFVSWNGTESFPLSLLVATNLYGDDARKINDDDTSTDFNTEDGIQYSTYIELGYGFSLRDNTELSLFIGATPNNPKEADMPAGYLGEGGFYADDPGIINLGMTVAKELPLTDKFSLPVSGSLIFNPSANNVFLVFGITL